MTRMMKDSGVEWIGEIPENWVTVRTKIVATLFNGNSIKDDEKSQYEDSTDAIPYIATKDIDSLHNIDYCNGMYVKNDDHNFKVAHKNSTLMCIEGGSAGIKKAKLKQDVCFVNKLCCFEPKSIDSDYLYYFLNNPKYEDHFKSLMSGLIGGVSISDLKNINCTLPPMSEQQKIAGFLDEKCGAIDEIISKTEQSIEEYKKLKQSVITKAVTKGIRPNRPMQDSNIEWIGEIPENWQLRKLANIFHTVTDYVASGSFGDLAKNVKYLDSPDYAQLIRTTDVSGKGFSQKPVYIDEASYSYLKNSNLFGGEIILPNIGASVGDVYIVPKLYERMSLAPNSVMLKTNQNMKYFYYFFASKSGREALLSIAESTAQPKFNKTELRQLKIPLPTEQEQKEIAEYLDEKCVEIDALIEKKQQFLTELANYKKSLIYEYVTGKKEVA